MVGRAVKASVTALAAVAFIAGGANVAAAASYPPVPPTPNESDPPAPTPSVAPPQSAGVLPSTGGDTAEILQIGLAAVVTGGLLVGAATKRRRTV